MKTLRVSTTWPFALLVLATLVLLAPALRPGYLLLPAGVHRVTFTYSPPLLTLGAGIRAAAWLLLLARLMSLRLARRQVPA